MRIAYVSTDAGIPVFGTKGASIHVQEMLRAFLAQGAEISILSPRIEGIPPVDLAGIVPVALPSIPKGDPETRARAVLALNNHVSHALSKMGPLDMIYERHALHAHAAAEFAHQNNIPCILEVNAPLIEEQSRHRTLSLATEAADSAYRAMAAASAVLAVSPSVGEYARSLGAGRVEVVPNAVSPARFPQCSAPDGPFTIAFLGSLKPWHDVATALDALAVLRQGPVPHARMIVVGDGPERSKLSDHVTRLGLADAVTFCGAVSAAEVPKMLAQAHVGIAPYANSPDFYFSPLKLYEYMAAGLAVVASDVGHLAEVVKDGVTGLLTPPEEAAALAHLLAQLSVDDALRAALGTAARAEVIAHHTWDGVASRVFALAGDRGTAAT